MFGWEFPPAMSGGLGTACYGLTRAMAERGYDITFVMPKKAKVNGPWMRFRFPGSRDASIRIRTFQSTFVSPYITSPRELSKKVTGKKQNDTGFSTSDFINEVRRYALFGAQIATEEDFDVIYAHDWLSFGAGIAAKRVTGKPLIAHIHSTEFDRSGGGSMGINQTCYDLEREGMQEANAIVAVSEFTKSIVVEKYGIDPRKVFVAYNGIDSVEQSSSKIAQKLSGLKDAGYKMVLFLGRLTVQKGPEYFVRAAKRAVEFDPDIMFVMTGNGEMEEELKKLAYDLGIGDKVYFTGWISGAERFAIFSLADLYIMPSVSEPFGIVALEAIKMGTPVIVSKQSGVAEVLQNALKVDFWDVDEMAQKIVAVTRMPGISATLTDGATPEVERLTWGAAADSVDKAIHSVFHSVQ